MTAKTINFLIFCVGFILCDGSNFLIVKRGIKDLCGEKACSKLYPTCSVEFKRQGIPSCLRFNNVLSLNIDKNHRGSFRFPNVQLVAILNGYAGWRKMREMHISLACSLFPKPSSSSSEYMDENK